MREYRPEELHDPRNADIVVHVGGELLPRAEAKVSVFDSSVQGGDAVWEGLRVYDGKIFQLEKHLDRLEASAHTMAFEGVPSRANVKQAIFETLEANGMRDRVHIRLTLTRGPKLTSNMNPAMNRAGCCLIVLAEWKGLVYSTDGIRLITASVRRNSPQTLDSKIHHNNLINNILAKIEANVAGVDDAVMLDLAGFLSETNATNIFVVRRGELLTPRADSCLPGITRDVVLSLSRGNGIPTHERNLSPSELYNADEAFTTGTAGELTPILEVDGRALRPFRSDPAAGLGPVTTTLQGLYRELTSHSGEPLPF